MTRMERTAALPLEDADLFRERALIGGAWVEAASGARVAVADPATGATLGHVPDVSAAETRAAIEAAEAAFGPWRRRTHGERAALLEAWFALMQAHAEDLAQILTAEQGKPLDEARGEIAYGASFVKWFAEEARRIEGSVIPSPTPDRRIVIAEGAGRGLGHHHAVELPERHDHPQGRAGARRRLHRGDQAIGLHALLGAGARGPGRARRHPGRRRQHRDRHAGRDRRRADRQPGGAQDFLHRLDAGGIAADGPVGAEREAALARARRQCALHRLRRCRSRCGGGRGDRLEVPQRRPDLRLREPHPGAGRRARRLRRAARGAGPGDEGRAGHRARRRDRPDDQRRRRREDRPPRRRCAGQGGDGARPRRGARWASTPRRWC